LNSQIDQDKGIDQIFCKPVAKHLKEMHKKPNIKIVIYIRIIFYTIRLTMMLNSLIFLTQNHLIETIQDQIF